MTEQFFEPLQPDKGKFLKQWIFVFIIISVLFCALVWYDGYRQEKKEQAPTIGYVTTVGYVTTGLDDKCDEIEAWKDENAWLFKPKVSNIDSLNNEISSFIVQMLGKSKINKYYRLKGGWINSNSTFDSGYPVPTNNELYHAIKKIQELQDSQLILQRKYDSLNKKFEQWKAVE